MKNYYTAVCAAVRRRIGIIACAIGRHKWGKEYVRAGDHLWFGMGHHAQDCQRKGCEMTKHHPPA